MTRGERESWDGSDVFYFKNWDGVLIVTRRVKELLEENRMKNMDFIDVEDYVLT